MKEQQIIIYKTADGKASVSLYAKDGSVWMNQNQLAELFDTSIPNISMHISNILKERELEEISVVKDYLTTATDGKDYQVSFGFKLDLFGVLKSVKKSLAGLRKSSYIVLLWKIK